MEEFFAGKIFESLIGGGAGGAISISVMFFIGRWWIGGLIAEHKALRQEFEELKEERIKKIDTLVDEHIKEDSSAVIATKLDVISGNLTKLSGKVDIMNDSLVEARAEIKANAQFLTNVNKSLQYHKDVTHASLK
jgi:hypothetical protein